MTITAEYPTPAVYARAVQITSRFDQSLRACRTRQGAMAGLPLSFTGANAIVFPMDDDDGAWALRFFTNAMAADPSRYSALERFQDRVDLRWPARCRWLDHAVRIGDDWFPGLRMEFIDGVLLDQYVLQLANAKDTRSLRELAEDWREMLAGLQRNGLAHGDLQHGNVLVERATGSLRLVDFDGIWLDELSQDPPSERGHGSYQHPGRLTAEHWGPYVDSFSGLLVYLSLRALAADPSLSRHMIIGNSLLIAESELLAVSGPDAPVLSRLAASPDREVAGLTDRLIDWLRGPANRDLTLEQVLDGSAATAGSASHDDGDNDDRKPPRSGSARPLEWWEHSPAADGTVGTVGSTCGSSNGAVGDPSLFNNPEVVTGNQAPREKTGRQLPSVGDIRDQVAAASGTGSPVTTAPATVGPMTTLSGHIKPAAAMTNGNRRVSTPRSTAASTSTSTPTGQGGTTVASDPGQAEILGRRLVAALVDATLGLLLLHLLWLADGEAPGKRAGGLVTRRTSGGRPSYGRLVVRELVLKQLPVDLALLGTFLGVVPLVMLSLGWLTVGGVLALGPTGRTLWDQICDTEVATIDAATNAVVQIGPSAARKQTGDLWW